ncbi:MAG: glycoside hydrolase family 3 C-terminal domain-containing protein [Bacteroidales bacterium]|nr:glycoside hydrolase family 3 C-terminal domain-containing protein [Bacteroidales bacterium]
MKKTIISIAAALCTVTMFAQPQLKKDNLNEVLKAMTLEEKAALCVGGARAAIVEGVTSGLVNEVPGAAGNTRPIARLGIPNTVLADGPAGLRINPTREGAGQTFYCTGFPVGTLLASSWDVALVQKVTEAMGNEVLEYGVDVLLAPGTNIHRNPLCGRNFEYFSEDPILSGNIAAAYINGIQANGVGTSLKHYAANNQETNRNEDDAIVSARALREIYLKTFEIAIKKADPWTVMSSYNKLNGEYTQQSEDLLTKVLREDWGYKGIVMTDWGNKQGTVKAVHAQNDLMEPGNQNEIDRIVAAVKDGTLSEADLDRNVLNMLTYIVKTPHFNNYKYSNKPDLAAHAKVAREGAAESIVLLKNDGAALPMAGNESVALYGIGAIDFVAGGTGSGNVNKAYVVNMVDGLKNAGFKLDQAIIDYYQSYIAFDKASKKLAGTAQGWSTWGGTKYSEIAVPANAVASHAKANDAAIIVIGRNAGEGADRKVIDDFELTDIERNLISNVSREFHALGKKVVVVLNIGGVIETASWKHLADAIVLPWSPGQEGANAVADILVGKVNPSGKLPMTFPISYIDHPSSANFPSNYTRNTTPMFGWGRPAPKQKDVDFTNYEEGIWVGYRFFETNAVEVSYPFGFGLSYTSFAYSKPVVKAGKDGFTATVTVTNTGKVAGKEVVELYVSAPAAGLEKPEKELKAFAKTGLLQPGQSETLTFEVSAYELASFNENANCWETAAGAYTVKFGASVADIRATAAYKQAKAQTWAVSNAFVK